jgi:filamentous hemagglutinin family protein
MGRRGLMLAATALCGAASLLAPPAAALPDPGAAVVTPAPGASGGAAFAAAPGSLTVNLQKPRTIIQWNGTNGFTVGAGEQATFNFANASDIVLNKSTTVNIQGAVKGMAGGQTGGNIWFYSPNGVIVGPNASLSASSIIFMRGPGVIDANFLGAADAAAARSVLAAAATALMDVGPSLSATSASIDKAGNIVLKKAAAGDLAALELRTADGSINVQAAGGLDMAATTMQAQGDVILKAGAAAQLGAVRSLAGDVRLEAVGAASLSRGDAGRDLIVTGADANLDNGTAARDIAVRALSGSVVIGTAAAGDDAVIRAAQGATVSGSLTALGAANAAGAADTLFASDPTKLGMVTLDLAGQTIDIKTLAGPIDAGALQAGTDIRLQAGGTAHLQSGTAGRDLMVDGGAGAAVDSGSGRDLAIRSLGGDVTVGPLQASDDIVVRAKGAVTAGTLMALGGADSGPIGAGDLMFATDKTSVGGVNFDLAGPTIDVKTQQGGFSGPVAQAGSDVRVQVGGALSLGHAMAGRDVLADGASVQMDAASGRDIAVRSRVGGVTLGTAVASDDVVIRSAAGADLGSLVAINGTDATGAADLLFQTAPSSLNGAFNLTGLNVDVVASGTINLTDGVMTMGDARLQTTGAGDLNINHIRTGRDLFLDGASVSVNTGTPVSEDLTPTLKAGRDIAIRARTGAVTLGGTAADGEQTGGEMTAVDDIVIRARTHVTTTDDTQMYAEGGADLPGVGDILFNMDKTSLGAAQTFGLTGSNLDIKVSNGGIDIPAPAHAFTDVRMQASGPIQLNDGIAGRDLLVDGQGVVIGLASAARDVAVNGRTAAVTVYTASAGDDIVIRGQSATLGDMSAISLSDGVGAADMLAQVAPNKLNGTALSLAGANIDVLTTGAITTTGAAISSSDVRFVSLGGGSAQPAAVQIAKVLAYQDILVDGDTVSATDTVQAGRDLAMRARAGALTLNEVAAAGDDILLRATGAVTTGYLVTTGAAGSAGVADKMWQEAGMATAGKSLNGGDIDVRGSSANVLGAFTTGVGSEARVAP